MVRLCLLYIFSLFLFSCSFKSVQYDFIKGFIAENDNQDKPQKNWTAYWLDKKIDLYAINYNDQIIFADEQINIFFKDYQIYKITGLEPHINNLQIESKDSELVYKFNGTILNSDSCQKREKFSDSSSNEIIFSQTCVNSKNGEIYKNQVWFNSQNLVTRVTFKLHPNYPLLKLSIK